MPTTTPDAGSIRDTLSGKSLSPRLGPLPTQTAPAPAAMSVGRRRRAEDAPDVVRLGIDLGHRLSSPSRTQTLPSPTATLDGAVPKEIVSRSAPVSGSSAIAPAVSCVGVLAGEPPRPDPDSDGEHEGAGDGDAHRVAPGGRRHDRRARPPRRRTERGVLLEDLALEMPERLARLEPELGGEVLPAVLVRLQRLRLATRAVQRQHELTAEALAERVALDERLELADQLVVPSEREVAVDPLLEGRQAELVEPGDLRLRERLVREVGEGRPAPERERVTEPVGCQLRIVARDRLPSLLQQALERVGVERLGSDRRT